MRRVITELLEHDPMIRVVGTAGDGRAAITLVEQLRPDVVTMDVRMPIMDGLATTEHLMAYCPTPILVLTASVASHEIDITFKMLGAGALEIFEKPSGANPQALERAGHDLIRRIKLLARVKVVTHLRGRRKSNPPLEPVADPGRVQRAAAPPQPAAEPPTAPRTRAQGSLRTPAAQRAQAAQPARPAPFPLIVIGASTGGPRIVHQILGGLPGNLSAAVVVVQHIAAGFSAGMVEWLAHASKMPISLAYEGQTIRPGEVLIAPDLRDLLITHEGKVHLSDTPLLIQRPAIDIAMQAAAEVFGARAIGVLLTGMGRDGAYGMLTIRRARGYTIAQDEASSAIFGMPRAAIQLDAVDEVLSPTLIAARLVEIVANLNRQNDGQPFRTSV
jgi:two-component system chemotaxis response regulator CheB